MYQKVRRYQMPFNKELKKFLKKIPRETGRIVGQVGNFIEDLTDNTRIENLGKSIAKEGSRIVARENEKLNGSASSSASPAFFHAVFTPPVPTPALATLPPAAIEELKEEQTEPKKHTQEDIKKIDLFFNKHAVFEPTPSAPPSSAIMPEPSAPPAPAPAPAPHEAESDEHSELKSISSYSSSLLFHQNQELSKRVEQLEAKIKMLTQQIKNDVVEPKRESISSSSTENPTILTFRLVPKI